MIRETHDFSSLKNGTQSTLKFCNREEKRKYFCNIMFFFKKSSIFLKATSWQGMNEEKGINEYKNLNFCTDCQHFKRFGLPNTHGIIEDCL